MAKYTIELRKVCDIYTREEVENWFKDYNITDYLSQEQIQTIEKLNVWSKDKLARKIVDHYYMREIGFETPALFKHYAKVTMQEIMERMFPVIYSNSLEYDPLESVNFDITETRNIDAEGTAENNGISNSNSNSNASGFNINNDTPQQRITKQNLDSGIYASNTNQSDTNSTIEDETTTNNKSKSNSNTVETFSHHEFGNKGVLDSYQKMIIQYRETIFAVDEKIIKELNSLFMGLY